MKQEKVINRWLVVVGSLVIGCLGGLMYAWSLFVQPICVEYGWNIDQVALMGNVMMATFCLGATVGGNLLPKLGSQKTSIIGSLLFGLGVLISAFVRVPGVMYVTWGLCAGLGVGILYAIGMYVASAWFPDKRGMIMGLFLALFGLSLTIFSTPISFMLSNLGVQTTMLIMGVIITVVLGGIAVFLMKMPPEGWVPPGQEKVESKAGVVNEAELVSVTPKEAFRTTTFWLYFLAFFFLVIPYSFISSYTVVFATEYRGLSMGQAVTIVSMMGIGAAVGRFLGGVVLDKLGCKVTYSIFCLCSVVAGALLITSQSYTALLIAFLLVSAGYGGRTPMYGVFSIQQFGPKNASAIYGNAILSTVASSLIGPAITATTRAATGSFTTAIIISMVVSVVGMLCIVFTPKVSPVMKKNQVKSFETNTPAAE